MKITGSIFNNFPLCSYKEVGYFELNGTKFCITITHYDGRVPEMKKP